MQSVMNFSKYLLAVLTFSFLVTWNSKTTTDLVRFNFGDSTLGPAIFTSVAKEDDEKPKNPSLRTELAPKPLEPRKPIIVENPSTDTAKKTSSSVWKNISDELKLDHHVQSSRVQAEIRKILAERDKLNQILEAASPYIYHIHKQTQKYRLPAELALIPIIESEFNPRDHSNKGATGLWQLMPGTARLLGVKIREGYDGRRNVVSSTRAALIYFRDLGVYFKGNWNLAIAAYNCGQAKINSAKRKAGSTSFWSLTKLPKETKLYVPRLLAVAAIVKHPEKYGVELPRIKNEPYFAEIKVTKPITLEHLAKSTNTNIATLKSLNPDYKHKITPKKGTDSVLVPAHKASIAKEHLEN